MKAETFKRSMGQAVVPVMGGMAAVNAVEKKKLRFSGTCNNCGKSGHKMRECYLPGGGRRGSLRHFGGRSQVGHGTGYIGFPWGNFGGGFMPGRFNGQSGSGSFNHDGGGHGFRNPQANFSSGQQYEEDGSQYAYDVAGNIVGYAYCFGTFGPKSNFRDKSQTTGPVHSLIQPPLGGGQGALKMSSLSPPKKGLFGAGPTEQGHTKDMCFELACNFNLTDPMAFSTQDFSGAAIHFWLHTLSINSVTLLIFPTNLLCPMHLATITGIPKTNYEQYVPMGM